MKLGVGPKLGDVDYVRVGTKSQSQCMYRLKSSDWFWGINYDRPSNSGWFPLPTLFEWYGTKMKVKKICDGKDIGSQYD